MQFYGELMHTNHNPVCLMNIDLIIIFDLFSHFLQKQNNPDKEQLYFSFPYFGHQFEKVKIELIILLN